MLSRGRAAYGIALVLFLVVSGLAWRQLPPLRIEWGWLALTALMAPLTLLLNGLEYRMAGELLQHRIQAGEALRISVLASAANLLPLPGGVLVRSEALRRRGAELPGALRSNAAIGVVWVSTALLMAGGVQLFSGGPGLGSTMLVLGAFALGLAAVLARISIRWRPWIGSVLLLEAVFVGVAALRLLLVFRGLGIPCTAAQAVVVTLAGALASAAGVFPGGLGLREVLAGGLAIVVRIPAAAGTAAAAVDRVIGLAVLALAAAFVMVRKTANPVRGDA